MATAMSGGESAPGDGDALAPVIPLFGDRRTAAPPVGADGSGGSGDERPVAPSEPASPVEHADAVEWHTSWVADDDPEPEPADDDDRVDAAEAALLRKLRGRSLSVREARGVLAAHDLDEAAADGVIARFERNGYLDDARLAEQLIHTAVERKGQGRRVVAQALAQRGIPREVVDAALAEVPDDDAERALEFARHKARSMTDLDRDVALRRLAGQLARRGYGARALDVARQALDEAATGRGGRSGVRFT